MRVVATTIPAALGLAACLSSPPGAGPPGLRDAEPDAPAPADASACAPLFDEPFATLDEAVWSIDDQPGDGTITVKEETLVLDADPGAGGDYTYLAVSGRDGWSLPGLTVTADVNVAWEGPGDVALLVDAGDGYIGVYADSDTIGAAKDLGGGFELLCTGDPCSTIYSSIDHRFWRIREADGNLHFEASDGEAPWIELAPPHPTPPGTYGLVLWSECGPPNRAVLEVERIEVSRCDEG